MLATRNFDLSVRLNADAKSEAREYIFSAIDRTEYGSLFDFFTSRRLNVIVPEVIAKDVCPYLFVCLFVCSLV